MKRVVSAATAALTGKAAILAAALAAFTAFADGLPEGYTQVPFIKANGNCQIQTGIVPNSTDKVELSWRPSVVSGNQGLWCSRDSSAKNSFTAFMISNKVRLDRNGSSTTCAGLLLACTNYTVVADYATLAGVVTNDISHTELTSGTMPSGDYAPTAELCLFASCQGTPTTSLGNWGSWACYSFMLSDSAGNLRLNLVPAKRDADGELGLYDLVRSTFLTNCNSGVFTTDNMTITPTDPLWGKALTIADNITIDAGDGATWTGAITVRDGGSLTTRGNLNVSGSTTVDVGASVDVETGTQLINFAQNIKGSLTVRADATLKFNAAERFHNSSATAVFHLYGTMDVQNYQQRIDKGTYFFHDGARVVNKGSATLGGLYVYEDSRVVFDGNVAIEPPIALVDAKTFTVACCENAHVSFKGGVIVSATGRQAGNIVQVAATVAEGNAAGTCANAFLDFGPVAVGDTYDFTGSFTFLSNAKLALGLADTAFSVTTSGAELEIVSDKAVAFANHATAQTLPVITTTTASVRLTGDGTVSLPTAALTCPIEFAGPSIVMTNNVPVALAAGSSVTAPTTVGVEGLAANTAATIFTGADSSFDVSKISVKPAHNGVPFGDAAAASLSGTDVVTAGVPAYVSYGWVEPYIAANALIWLDAADAANFEFKDNTFGLVTTWKDRTAYKRDATAYTVPSHEPNWGTLMVTNGVPAYCMGDVNSGIDMQYTSMSYIRTGFFAMSIRQSIQAFFLGRSNGYNFHRGSNGEYSYGSGGNQDNVWFEDGVQVASTKTTLVPTDRHVYSFYYPAGGNLVSDRLTCDRNSGSYQRHGGRELSELILFNTILPESDRKDIESYLDAKWMGANPTAAGAEGTYAVKSDLAVDDHVGGDKNLSFGEGASVTVVNPSSTGALVATTGSVTIPSGYALPVAVDASNLAPGTYTVIQAGSGITDISQFAPTATTASGATATFSVVDGKLVMTIAGSSAATAQTWRPTSSADLGWNATSANWQYDGGTTGGFLAYVPAFIDGAETATGDITVSGTIGAGPVSVTGANDYTFKGDGTLAGNDTVTFGGTGTITLDGLNLADQNVVITNGQKVVLGFNAGSKSFGNDSGSSGGKVTIAEGSQFNVNFVGAVGGTADPRSEITQLKTFVIAGDGLDGRGAIVNDALDGRTSHGSQNCSLRRIELSGDASIGGADRVDLRVQSGTAATATPGIYGPGKTLTVKNNIWFASWSQPINVQSILIPVGGNFLPVQMTEAMFNIPGGITLDGGLLDHYQNTYPSNMPFYVTANGGTFQSGGGASTVKGDVSVASGASLAFIGDRNVTYSGAFNANGATITNSNTATIYFTGTSSGNLDITQTAGTMYYQDTVNGNLDITQTAGTVQLQNKVGGTVTLTKSAGDVYLGSGFSNNTVNVTQSGGNFRLYPEATAPIFEKLNINLTGGDIHVQPQTSKIYDVGDISITSPDGVGNIYMHGPNGTGDYGIATKLSGTMYHVAVGGASGAATLRIKSGSDVSVQAFQTGAEGNSKALRGCIIIDNGARVVVRGSNNGVRNGRRGTAPDTVSTHVIDISGYVDSSTRDVYVLDSSPRGEFYLHEGGVLKAKGLQCTPSAVNYYTNGVTAAEGRCWFMMDGGLLEIGSTGIVGARVPGVTKFDLQAGTVKSVAAWSTSQMFPLFFGYETLGGEVELDLDSYNLTWNSGISGASDLTIKGAANFVGKHDGACVQGAMLGKVTVQNTGANDLKSTSAFSGGLTLADGVNAEVAKYTDEFYPAAMGGGTFAPLAISTWSYPFAAADMWSFVHTRHSTKPYPNSQSILTRGEFYVPEEKAGAWTFAGVYDDKIRLDIDGEELFTTASASSVGRATVTLAAGWHKFTLVVYDNTGSAGPNSNGWTNGKALGFVVGEETATAGGSYTKFEPGASLGDGLTLQVRPAVNACVWSWQNGNSNWSTTENWSHIKCMDSVSWIHKHSNMSDKAEYDAYMLKMANRYQGWFKVEDDKAGEWTFKIVYDDRILLAIDGNEVTRTTSASGIKTGKRTLAAGWHRWDVRTYDGGGGWGPHGYNNDNAISYIAPGDTEKQFNETNLKLAATLGDIAVLEPSGIYKELELGAGSTLTSSGTMAMPIFGTLKGTGTLAGSFAFAGTTNCWEATCTGNNKDLTCATFSAATPATFAGLKSVKVTFDGKPTRRAYYLTSAIDGLADAPAATVIATAGETDYSANFTLTVKNGRLALANSKPAGVTIIVR